MNHLHYVLFSALITCSHSLKLLVEEEPEAIDDEWEDDITFSYKPLKGKCKAAGDFKLTQTSTDEYGGSTDGVFCVEKCDADGASGLLDAGLSLATIKKYCRPGNLGENQTFEVIKAKWKSELTANNGKRKKECAHKYAKLASMQNVEAKCLNNKIYGFDLKADDCAVRAFQGNAACVAEDSPTVGYFCYCAAGIAWAKNDPKVKNMDGEEFDIMATGTFTLLSLQKLSSEKVSLEVLSTIDRAGTRCGATYIQNVTLRGQWVEDVGVPEIQVRAVPAVPKNKALEVNFNGSWQPSNSHWQYASVQQATSTRFNLKINQVTVLVAVDSHRIHEDGVKTKRFANFLNIKFDGVSKLSGISIRGLLGRDSHAEAAELPADCTSSSLLSSDKTKTLSSAMLL
jgi:hypothetical protein